LFIKITIVDDDDGMCPENKRETEKEREGESRTEIDEHESEKKLN
jgi:hypothetical protein